MKRVIALENRKHLTLRDSYTVISESECSYKVMADDGIYRRYGKECFVEDKE